MALALLQVYFCCSLYWNLLSKKPYVKTIQALLVWAKWIPKSDLGDCTQMYLRCGHGGFMGCFILTHWDQKKKQWQLLSHGKISNSFVCTQFSALKSTYDRRSFCFNMIYFLVPSTTACPNSSNSLWELNQDQQEVWLQASGDVSSPCLIWDMLATPLFDVSHYGVNICSPWSFMCLVFHLPYEIRVIRHHLWTKWQVFIRYPI